MRVTVRPAGGSYGALVPLAAAMRADASAREARRSSTDCVMVVVLDAGGESIRNRDIGSVSQLAAETGNSL